ncbi:hypothetical protein AB0D86_47580 [Streptomyces sp. NPDC048324]|uniref:hypothetical protein n=1 Tax=Streptomyces sp. NPDC048324 TaxID=3157205 RepID=UPI003418B464
MVDTYRIRDECPLAKAGRIVGFGQCVHGRPDKVRPVQNKEQALVVDGVVLVTRRDRVAAKVSLHLMGPGLIARATLGMIRGATGEGLKKSAIALLSAPPRDIVHPWARFTCGIGTTGNPVKDARASGRVCASGRRTASVSPARMEACTIAPIRRKNASVSG